MAGAFVMPGDFAKVSSERENVMAARLKRSRGAAIIL